MIGFAWRTDPPGCRWQWTRVQSGGDRGVERTGSSRSAVTVVDGSLEKQQPFRRSNPQDEVKDRP